MRHHAEHPAIVAQDAGDVGNGTVRVGAGGVAEGDAVLAFEAGQRLAVGEIVAVVMGDRAAQHLALGVGAGERRIDRHRLEPDLRQTNFSPALRISARAGGHLR